MKGVFEKMFQHFDTYLKWNLTELALDFLERNTQDINGTEYDLDIGDDDSEELKYVATILNIFNIIKNHPDIYDITGKNVGDIVIKLLFLEGKVQERGERKCDTEYWEHFSCDDPDAALITEAELLMDQLHRFFTIPGQNISLPQIAYLYSLIDFRALVEKPEDIEGTKIDYKIRTSKSIDERFDKCFIEVANNFSTNKEEIDDPFKNILGAQKPPKASPCLSLEKYPQCLDYCRWHKNLFKNWKKKEEFLTVMRYALPQRKLMELDPIIPYEKELAAKVFGVDNIKNLEQGAAPLSSIIFCHSKVHGFTGDAVSGMKARLCNDFFPSPTDVGMCLAKNLKINEIMKPNEYFDTIFDSSFQPKIQKIESGTTWSEDTLVLFTDLSNDFRQTYPRLSKNDIGEIEFQLHQPEEIGKVLKSSTYNKFKKPIVLKAGYEYFIDVTPTGQIPTEAFKNLNLEARKCKLEHEVSESSVFKVYTKNNCEYECHANLALEKCQCVPWDFVTEKNHEECDIFGRSCFFDTIKNLTISPEDPCNEICLKECNHVDYHKELTMEKNLFREIKARHWDILEEVEGTYLSWNVLTNKITDGNEAFMDFISDKNGTFTNNSIKDAFNNFSKSDSTNSDALPFMDRLNRKYKDMIVIHLKYMNPEMHKIDVWYTILDKFANFVIQVNHKRV